MQPNKLPPIGALIFILLLLATAPGRALADESSPSFVNLDAFANAHPDVFWRKKGAESYQQGRYGEAMTGFRRAAGFADKPSQAMIAQMLWNGDGIPVDHVMAYVWADLAAERGYPDFIATRERFWLELSEDERTRAVAAGQAVFDEYADVVAKPRLERAVQRARQAMTGSRTGRAGTMDVFQIMHETGTYQRSDGAQYYADKYWDADAYWQWQDSTWKQPPKGKVDVGPIRIPPEK